MKKKNDKTNLNWSYKYLPRTLVGSTAMNVNLGNIIAKEIILTGLDVENYKGVSVNGLLQ